MQLTTPVRKCRIAVVLTVLAMVSLHAAGARAQVAPAPLPVADAPLGPALPPTLEPPRPPPPLQDATTKRATMEMATYSDTDHVTVFTPSIAGSLENVTQGASLRGSYLVDVVSAASVDIVSTASRRWHEVRQAGALEGEYKPHDLGISVGGSVSSEPDYLSYGIGIAATRDFNEKNTTLLLGYGFAHDTSGRAGTPFSVFARTIDHSAFNAGITQLIDRATVLGVAADLILDDGDSSKPYRYIPMFAPGVAPTVPKGASIGFVTDNRLSERPLEQLPLTRQRLALTGRLDHRFRASTLRLDQRIYGDTWGLVASTTDARWIIDVGRRFAVWPHLRAHVQSAVNFWKRAYVSTGPSDIPEYRTGDRELGPLRTTTLGAGVLWYLGRATDPAAFSLTLQGDVGRTSFLDDLYLTSRTAGMASLTFTGEL